MAEALLPGSAESPVLGPRSGQDVARRIAEAHRKGLQARRDRDLLAEKILLHIDGSADNMWADIYMGQRVAIPRDLPEPRVTENLLRPIIANQVAYHTTMPLRFIDEGRQDRESRERAVINAAFANYVVRTQRVNQLSAAGMYLADAMGFCPLHAFWRDDVGYDPYEPLYTNPDEMEGMALPRKGLIDCWVGNPFDTVFNAGAKRGSIQWQTYGRVLPGQTVRDRFGVDIEGTDKLPSASVFQRIARQWSNMTGLNIHGTPAMGTGGGNSQGEDLIAVICREIAPGVDPEFPMGRLSIVALPGQAETRGGRDTAASAILLADQPLPAGRFSSVNLYSEQRFDDVLGSPWAEPLAELNTRLNISLSDRRALIEKAKNAPIITNGEIGEDSRRMDGWTVLEAMGGMGGVSARVMEAISSPLMQALNQEIEEIRQAIYTIGGYQAASRGESDAGDPYAKVALLSQQDDTIHGATNQAFREACVEYAQLWWSLMKEYGDVPWMIAAVGDEFEEMPEEYIDNTMLSDEPPAYKVVSGYGSTPEIKGRQLLDMVQRMGADQQPLLTTEEFRAQWPDGSLFDQNSDPKRAQKRRARRISNGIRRLAKQMRQQNQLPQEIPPQIAQQAGMWVFQTAEQQYPRERSDDLQANIDALVELVQDETEDPVARAAGRMRLDLMYEWQAMMQPAMPMGAPAPGGSAQKQPTDQAFDPASAATSQMGSSALDADPMGGAIPAA